VLLKQPSHQMRHRVLAQICGQISDPQLVMTPRLAGPQWSWQERNLVLDIVRGALQLQPGIITVSKQH
jgi:hypothetical protein